MPHHDAAGFAPIARAAVTNSCSLRVMNCPRTSRAVPGQEERPITITVVRNPVGRATPR